MGEESAGYAEELGLRCSGLPLAHPCFGSIGVATDPHVSD